MGADMRSICNTSWRDGVLKDARKLPLGTVSVMRTGGPCRESLHEKKKKKHGGGSQSMGFICTGHTLGKKVFDLIVD